MNLPCSVAVAQTSPIPGDVPSNLEEHLALARLAAAEGAQVVVFPELSLTGYELELADELAFEEDDVRLRSLAEEAVAGGTVIIAGAPVRIDSRLHLGAFILGPRGTRFVYTKHRLGTFPPGAALHGTVPQPEGSFFEPGNRNPLVPLAGGPAAVAICADIGLPEHAAAAASRGATAYLASVFSIPSDIGGDLRRLRSYATRHAMVVAMANFGSASGGLSSAGLSSVWSENGELIVQLGEEGSGVGIATRAADGWRGHVTMLFPATDEERGRSDTAGMPRRGMNRSGDGRPPRNGTPVSKDPPWRGRD